MSAQDSNLSNPVRYRKPRADIYTLLLAIALVALIIACVFAYMELKDYGTSPFSGAPSAAIPFENPTHIAMTTLPEQRVVSRPALPIHG